jgi:hypothetical protein
MRDLRKSKIAMALFVSAKNLAKLNGRFTMQDNALEKFKFRFWRQETTAHLT